MSLVSRKVNQISLKTIFLRGVLYSTKDVIITLCDTCPIFREMCLKSREENVSHQSWNDSNLSRYVLRFFSFLTELPLSRERCIIPHETCFTSPETCLTSPETFLVSGETCPISREACLISRRTRLVSRKMWMKSKDCTIKPMAVHNQQQN